VLVHLWQTTLVLAVLALLAVLARRAPARYQEGLWTAGLLKLLVPLPLLAAFWPALRRLASTAGQQETIGPAIRTLSQLANPEMLWIAPVETGGGGLPPTFVVVATGSWAFGTAVLLAFWWRRSRSTVPVGDEPWHAPADIVERVTRAARAANVSLRRIRITDAAVVPCLRNLRKPLVIVSKAVVEHLGDDELQAVLIHEDAHRRRADLWRGAAQGLVTCVFFFYPPAWWLERRLRESAELACDEAVLAAGIDPRTYARALARTVDLGLASSGAPALSSGGSFLRTRLQRIKEPERYAIMTRHRFAVVAAFIAAVALSFVPIADGAGLAAAVGESQTPGEWLPAAQLRGLNGLETAVELNYQDAALAQVLEDLGGRAGFDVYFLSQADLTLKIQVAVSGTSVRDVLGLLADLRGIEYRVIDAETLIVRVRGEIPAADVTVTAPESEQPVRVIRRTPGGAPMRVGGDIKAPERVHYVAPEYPELARRARLEGFVILQAVIDKEGNVSAAEVLRGLGLGLDVAATDAVKQWRYTPTYYNGEAVAVILTVNVVFTLIQ
jgi:protein TonB